MFRLLFRQFIVIILTLSALTSTFAKAPATAITSSDPWTHLRSGASLPRSLGGQTITETHDLGDPHNSVAVYSGPGNAVESTTIYIFRAAIPDARLWFDRALPSVARDIPLSIFETGPVEQLRAFASPGPNGLYRIYTTSQQGPFRSTALAVAQAGEWVVKMRLSSATLDRAAMAARIIALADAIRFPNTISLSTLSPQLAACAGRPLDGAGRPSEVSEGNLAVATAGALQHIPRLRQPLSVGADGWCRDEGFPAERGTLLRLVGAPHNWALLAGDAGQAVVAISGGQMGALGDRRSVILVVTPAFVKIATMYEGTPPMLHAIQAAAPVLAGQTEGLLEFEHEQETLQR